MKQFAISVDINTSRDRVWAVMSDVERWYEWTPSVTSIRRLERVPFGVGSQVLIRQPKLPPALWKVAELVEGNGFIWISRGSGLHVTGRHWIEATREGCRVTLSIEYSGILGSILTGLTRRLNERYIALEAHGLKSRCEGKGSASRL